MRTTRTLIVTAFLILCMATVAAADNAVLASGAGYKKMVNALNTAYTKQTGQTIDLLFGNMARVTTLAKQTGNVDIVIGDASFLDKAALEFAIRQPLGKGRLVLAFAKKTSFSSLSDLDTAGRIALPDVNKAIYGKAARQFLQSTKRLPDIKPRLVEVATVPQVFSYLTTNEIDMGFMNLTHTLNVTDKLGGYVVINQDTYSPIIILAGLLKDSPRMEQAKDFLHFLETPEAQAIIQANGL
ncbi:molybdate ABC transporter substrate-binding protein [Pseudodesulfovibrio sp. JC047]|uniref:molybdate ABC transporter substrate-binding protein n=1 Tax=Pseudodesulfovibrio sp. JC047 TaxID=2683199 RepID=UPI0013D87E2B|nr:molybdate ABC transporter substrate-binding protein [Pseudodesulfovibrio sp. JC047]NDV19880.1 molybdate ABC transporter substrate-binding protein [Pseudodesulfovibrio sp. JC047]